MERRYLYQHDHVEKAIKLGMVIKVTCKGLRCTHAAYMDPLWLSGMFHGRKWSSTLIAVSGKLRCTKCGSKWPEVKAVDRAEAMPGGRRSANDD
jgi:hypothetical protein